MARIKKDPIDRFKEKYIVDPNTGCWNWTGAATNIGYGILKVKGKNIYAHRFAYETFKGSINNLFVMHKCDNRKCCCPDHLFLGTHLDNMLDCKNKDRFYKPKGIKNSQVILSEYEVIEIKKSLINYYWGKIKDLAHYYKVDEQTISDIKSGKRWSHIQIP